CTAARPRDVMGTQYRNGGGFGQAVHRHHGNVRIRNRQDPGRTVRRRANGSDPIAELGVRMHGMRWEERDKVIGYRYRADTRTAAAVRYAERLMQIQVGHVAAELARLGET